MASTHSPLSGLRLEDTLRPGSKETVRVVGHLLRSLYAGAFSERPPEAIESAVVRLEALDHRRTGGDALMSLALKS
ncbi:MAG: hypothetical protein ABW026_03225 [Microvirga sp.]